MATYARKHNIGSLCQLFHQSGVLVRSYHRRNPERFELLGLLCGPHEDGDIERARIRMGQEANEDASADVTWQANA